MVKCCLNKKSKSIRDYICKVRDYNQNAPANVYLLPGVEDRGNNNVQPLSSFSKFELHNAALEIKRLLLEDTKETGKRWIVLCDTDGGEQHAFNDMSVMLADKILISIESGGARAFDEVERLGSHYSRDHPGILPSLSELHKAGHTKAQIAMVTFNKATCMNNNALSADLPNGVSPFKMNKITSKFMNETIDKLRSIGSDDDWANKYSNVLGLFATRLESEVFTTVRQGAVGFGNAHEQVWRRSEELVNADTTRADWDLLSDKLQRLIGF
jgi:hypothetical protein